MIFISITCSNKKGHKSSNMICVQLRNEVNTTGKISFGEGFFYFDKRRNTIEKTTR